MPILIAHIEVPPSGELETKPRESGELTDEQMAEELAARERAIATMRPLLASLPERPARRSGNISRVELLGENTWTTLNHYVVFATVDIGNGGLEEELLTVLPEGSKVSVAAGVVPLEEWPEPKTGAEA